MSWTTPTSADLLASLSADELAQLEGRGISAGQDVAAQIIARTIDTVRGFVRRSGVTLGAAGTIPPELLAPAMDIACVDWFLRLNLDIKPGRSDRRRDAMTLLRDMAAGTGILVVGPDADTATAAHTLPSIEPIDRTAGRGYESGI